MGTAASTGWIIGGVLFLVLAVWIMVMLREIRNAVELPNSLSNSDDTIDAEDKPAFERSRTGVMDGRKTTPERGHKSRPRKLRSRAAELPGLIGR